MEFEQHLDHDGEFRPAFVDRELPGVAPGFANGDVVVSDQGCQAQGQGPICVGSLSFSGTANNFIFVGTDPSILSANSYYLALASGTPAGGTYGGTSSDSNDKVTMTWVQSLGLEKATIQTADQSATVGDRTLTFTYTPPTCPQLNLTLNLTARQFAYATNDNPPNSCALAYGTDRTYTYTVFTHPDKTAVDANSGLSGTGVSENFNPALQCDVISGNGSLNSNGEFLDHIASACSSMPLTCTQNTTQTISVAKSQVRSNALQWTTSGVTYASNGPTQ